MQAVMTAGLWWQQWWAPTTLSELEVVERLSLALIASFLLAAVVLLSGVQAPYGRYSRAGTYWGWRLPGRVAWVLQELPNLLAVGWALRSADYQTEGSVLMVVVRGGAENGNSSSTPNVAPWVLLTMFTLHYSNRTLIFPLRIRGGKPTPLVPFVMATVYCSLNGYLQSRALTALVRYPAGWHMDVRFVAGVAVWLMGAVSPPPV
jgi:3-oxo-5-alpha-steroid 4-dehydrogenase 1